MARGSDPYAVLGVEPTATAGQIASAYRGLVRALHPDSAPARDEPERRAAAARFDEVVAAYEVLRDPVRRAAYDASRRRAAVPEPPRPAPRPAARSTPPAGGGLLWVGPVRRHPPRP
ncbi:J domain-containing protein [Streptomyces sp. NPDC101145]|uniref:J domain-containing protein n=1 Tax=Streptomyces sp. NPDC101145 TaxID=3366112 RepID=UPI0037F6BB9C